MLPNSNPNSSTKLMSTSKQRNEFNDDLEAAIEGTHVHAYSWAVIVMPRSCIGNISQSLSEIMKQNPNSVNGKPKKLKKKKKQAQSSGAVAVDNSNIPPEFLCNLSQKQMTEPVRSVYGNHFEKAVILDWFKNQGHICPITGEHTVVYRL